MVTPSRESVLAEIRALKAGIQKNMMADTVTLSSQTYSGAQLAARVDLSVQAELDVQTARGALADALTRERQVRATEAEFLRQLRRSIESRYKGSYTTLAEFGLEPRKERGALTGEQKILMAAKNRATRKKRGTLGKRQKAAIKGGVKGVTITPIVASAAGSGGGKPGA